MQIIITVAKADMAEVLKFLGSEGREKPKGWVDYNLLGGTTYRPQSVECIVNADEYVLLEDFEEENLSKKRQDDRD